MKEMKRIRKKDIEKFIYELKRRYEVIAPVEENGKVFFKILGENDDITLNYTNSCIPPKEFFIPEREQLFRFREINDNIAIYSNLSDICERERIIFGIRPCDVNALLILDNVAKDCFEDTYYFKRRDNTILIAIECTEPSDECFCSTFNTGPSLDKGADLILTDIGDSYLVNAKTKKGNKILNFKFFEDADEKDEKIADRRIRDAKNVEIKNIGGQIKPEILKHFSRRCLSCYSCTYICPTCYCFDVVDKFNIFDNSGERIRCWDSCMSPSFSRMAGNVNPRDDKHKRFINRINHKLIYMYERYKVFGCVGCGRCTINCPSGISMFAIIKYAQKQKRE
ncbi:MAG: sulfite reductase [Candidatus Altiarchaeales archaeon]|nr:MAG: sulfite reductase [Candidatus Altiarchaeales archaeon]